MYETMEKGIYFALFKVDIKRWNKYTLPIVHIRKRMMVGNSKNAPVKLGINPLFLWSYLK